MVIYHQFLGQLATLSEDKNRKIEVGLDNSFS